MKTQGNENQRSEAPCSDDRAGRPLFKTLCAGISLLFLAQTLIQSDDAFAGRRHGRRGAGAAANRGNGHGHGHGQGNGHGNGHANGHATAPGQLKKKAQVRPPRPGDREDAEAYALIQEEGFDVECERLGNKLRNLSNRIVSKVEKINNRLNNLNTMPLTQRERLREQNRRRVYLQLLQNTQFWGRVWDRLAEMYRSCDRDCFDDGEAVGEISGLGYCAASVAAEGLPGAGFTYQPPLPVCQTAIATGCQLGYRKAAQTFEGCDSYSNGEYVPIFTQNLGADCEIASLFE